MTDTDILIANYQSIIRVLAGQVRTMEQRLHLILQRQENIEIWEDGEAWIDDESFDELFPEIDFDDIDLSLEEE